jgi:nucleoside-diphosphate-sugar epimerase
LPAGIVSNGVSVKVLLVHDGSVLSELLAADLRNEQLDVEAVITAEVDDATLRLRCGLAHIVVYLSTAWDKVSAEREGRQVDLLISALRGSAKRLLYVSESTVIGDTRDGFGNEDSPRSSEAPHPWRIAIEQRVADAVSVGIHSIIVRVALVHGRGAGALLESLARFAELTGASVYVGDGTARVSTVHVDDVLSLIHLSLLRAPQASIYFAASDEVVTWQEVAVAIAGTSDREVKSVSANDAGAAGLDAATMSIANVVQDGSAHRRLGWSATGPSLLADSLLATR